MSTTQRVPLRALRAIADAVSTERSTSYATTEVGRAALLVALREQAHASPALAAQLAAVQANTPMSTSIGVGPGASVVHNAGPVFRAAYLIRAAQRIGAATDPAAQTAAEQRYLRQHQGAQMARELGAMRMDAARAAYGRTLGWYARGDDRMTPECAAANGKNFDPTHPPGIGLPGIGPHVGCRCMPGPPHEGAAFMPGAPSNVTALPGTTVREPAHLPGDDVISASVALVSGDTAPFSSSRSSNWVAKAGGLPPRVRAIARAVKRKHPEWDLSHCIAVAINAVKYSAATGDSKLPGRQNERASTVAAHGAAAARWSAMKASTHTAEGSPMLDLAKKAAKPKTTPDGKEVEGDGLTYDPGSKSFHPTTDAETASTKHPHVPKGSRQGGQFAKKQQADQKKQAAAETKKTKQQAAAQKKAAAATVATAKAKTATEKKQAAEKAKAARAALAAAKAAAPKKTAAAKKTAAPKATAPKSTSTTTTKVTTGPKGTTQTTTRTVKATAPTATAIGLAYGDGPLVTTTMMKDAIACVPKAKNPEKAKSRCVALAKRHGLTRMLPASWAPADADTERPETD